MPVRRPVRRLGSPPDAPSVPVAPSVPAAALPQKLRMAIQDCMNWEDSHLFSFWVGAVWRGQAQEKTEASG